MTNTDERFLHWYPIYAEPVPGSGEKVTVAVAVVSATSGRVFRLTKDDTADTPPLTATMNSLEPLFTVFTTLLEREGRTAIMEGAELAPAVSIGRKRRALSSSLEEVGQIGLSVSSVFRARMRTRVQRPHSLRHNSDIVESLRCMIASSAIESPANHQDDQYYHDAIMQGVSR